MCAWAHSLPGLTKLSLFKVLPFGVAVERDYLRTELSQSFFNYCLVCVCGLWEMRVFCEE